MDFFSIPNIWDIFSVLGFFITLLSLIIQLKD